MSRKQQSRKPRPPSVATAAFVAPAAVLVSASPPAPTRAPCHALLGPRPLIAGEDGTNYEVIAERISADVAPTDFVEEIWVRNVVDLVWESIRLRHLKSQLLRAAAHEGLARVLTPLLDWPSAHQLSRTWALGDEEASCEVERLLDRAGLTIDAVMAQTLAVRVDEVERIDRMVTTAEMRRDAVLREIGSRRAAFGQALRRAGQAIDAEFEDVAPAAGGA
jgi:hypothetical protein